jgi:hypothetical protein
MRRVIRALLVVAVFIAMPAALGAFTSTSSASNFITADPDWTRPTIDRTVIAKSAGYLAGSVKQSGTYYLYANVTDSGNPASGMSGGSAAVSANLTNVTTGQTGVALTSASGPWTVQGLSYNYRTSLMTATNPLSAGAKSYTITPTDADGNSGTATGYSVTVDNAAPDATDIQTANKTGGTSGYAEIGDTITFTFSEQIDPQSILAGWTGASTNVIVHIHDGGCLLNILVTICNDDSFEIYNGGSALTTIGPVNLQDSGYVGGGLIGTAGDAIFGSTGTASTMVQSGASITITLGTRSGTNPDTGGSTTMVWDSATSPYDAAGNAALGSSRNETGSGNKEF